MSKQPQSNDDLIKEARKKRGRRSKQRGHEYECHGVRFYGRFYKDVATTRACNRARDGEGVDLCNQNESKTGRFPFNCQMKASVSTTVPYPKLLDDMGDELPGIVHHQRSRKSKEGRFVNKGHFVTMREETHSLFLEHVYAIQLLRIQHPEMIAELEKQYGLELLNHPQQIKT